MPAIDPFLWLPYSREEINGHIPQKAGVDLHKRATVGDKKRDQKVGAPHPLNHSARPDEGRNGSRQQDHADQQADHFARPKRPDAKRRKLLVRNEAFQLRFDYKKPGAAYVNNMATGPSGLTEQNASNPGGRRKLEDVYRSTVKKAYVGTTLGASEQLPVLASGEVSTSSTTLAPQPSATSSKS